MKVKFSHTRYRALGPELIRLYKQSARGWLFQSPPAVNCYYSPRPAVTFPAEEHHHPLTGAKLYCLVTETHRCEQLAQGCYAALSRQELNQWPIDCLTATSLRYLMICIVLWSKSESEVLDDSGSCYVACYRQLRRVWSLDGIWMNQWSAGHVSHRKKIQRRLAKLSYIIIIIIEFFKVA